MLAENATHNLHNLLTLRGALVRDPHMWAHYLTEAIDLFADRDDVVFASHHWPTWGRDELREYLSLQRDLYAYLHDQTVRMLNRGMTGSEIAEAIQLPPALENAWHTHGYHGSVSHNVKAIYQRYMGWYDGNPAHLWAHTPAEADRRYLEFMGGADAVVDKARASFDDGDYRWVAEVVSHVIQVQPDHAAARELLADTYEARLRVRERHLAQRVSIGHPRAASRQLRHPRRHGVARHHRGADPEQLLDSLAIRVDAPSCWNEHLSVDLDLTDGDTYRVTLCNGVLVYTSAAQPTDADATAELSRAALLGLATGQIKANDLKAGVTVDGDASVIDRLFAVLQAPDPDFPILTPAAVE